MAGPVYKMFRARWKEAWFALSEEEQKTLGAKVVDALKQAGGKEVIFCNSSWSSEQWWAFGVEEFPDLEAVQQHTKLLEELNWMRYVEAETLLGTAVET
jgi:hypothetical protein